MLSNFKLNSILYNSSMWYMVSLLYEKDGGFSSIIFCLEICFLLPSVSFSTAFFLFTSNRVCYYSVSLFSSCVSLYFAFFVLTSCRVCLYLSFVNLTCLYGGFINSMEEVIFVRI